ncbi:MAG: hypothetical protein H0U35_07005 [Sporichthyaceae bacterium]|nr:hypothetical protein [Sporichthyaceae bacterium]
MLTRPAVRAALAAAAAIPLVAAGLATQASGAQRTPAATANPSSGPTTGLLPRGKFTIESTIKIDLDNQLLRLPLHRGEFQGETYWYILTDASEQGPAEALGLNFAPKLANAAIGCPACVQDVTLTAAADNVFGEGTLHFEGVPDFSPTRSLVPGPTGFPPASAAPGAVGDANYSPFVRVAGSTTVYNAPIVAVGDGPFDVRHHTDTAERVLAVHPAAAATGPGQFHGASVDLLFIRGFDSGQPIIYLSTESDDPATAVLERATFAPVLSGTPFVGGDDFLGSVRERIFPFVNGQTGAKNKQAQGLAHLILDGHAAEEARLTNRALINALRRGGDSLNIQGDFPTLEQNRRRAAYSPLWEAQFGEWTAKAVRLGLNKRQTDEFQILNLARTRPDLLTAPGGKPYGSMKVLINCPVIAFLDKEPRRDLVKPRPGSQVDFPGAYLR